MPRTSLSRLLRAEILTGPVVALALVASAAFADSDYPAGLFENSPTVPHGYQPPADAPPPATHDNAAPAAPSGADAEVQPPDAGAPPGPYGDLPQPPAPIAPAPRAYADPPGAYSGPPPYDDDYCAGIASRTFHSLGEVRQAHARCDRAYGAPPPVGYPSLY